MIHLIRNELYKAFHLKKIYFILCIIASMEIIYLLQYKFNVPNKEETVPNGSSLTITLLKISPQLMMIFIAVLIVDMIVEDYQNGTIKLSLLQPVSRVEQLNAKILAFIFILLALLVFLITFSYLSGLFLFGWENQVMVEDSTSLIWKGLWTDSQAMIFTLLPSLGYGMFVMFLALFTMNMSITLGLSLSLMILSPFLDSVERIKNYSIMYQMQALPTNFIQNPMSVETCIGIWSTLVYIALFYFGSVMIWKRKDLFL